MSRILFALQDERSLDIIEPKTYKLILQFRRNTIRWSSRREERLNNGSNGVELTDN